MIDELISYITGGKEFKLTRLEIKGNYNLQFFNEILYGTVMVLPVLEDEILLFQTRSNGYFQTSTISSVEPVSDAFLITTRNSTYLLERVVI